MNLLKYVLCSICVIAGMSCFDATAGDTISFSGGRIIFPDQDSVPDANIADLRFNLDKVPPDLKFMVGKVYRAEGRTTRYQTLRTKQYIFLYDWTEEEMKFLVARSRGAKIRAAVYTLTCPSRLSQKFNCTNEAGRTISRFSVQGGKPVLDATTGGTFIFEEVAPIPADISKPAAK
jgi:hypothetical protein